MLYEVITRRDQRVPGRLVLGAVQRDRLLAVPAQRPHQALRWRSPAAHAEPRIGISTAYASTEIRTTLIQFSQKPARLISYNFV